MNFQHLQRGSGMSLLIKIEQIMVKKMEMMKVLTLKRK